MKSWKFSTVYPIMVLLFAVELCVARVMELSGGFDISGLAIDGFEVGFMRGSAVAVVAITIAAAFASKPADLDFESGLCTGVGMIASVAAGFLLAAGGLVGIATYGGNMVRLVLGVFAMVAGACMVLAIKSKGGALSVLPVFFGCYLMLALYVEHSGDAVIERCGYLILASTFGTAALYCAASASFGVTKSRFKLAVSGVTVALALVAAVTSAKDGSYPMALIFLALCVYAAGEVIAICYPRNIGERVAVTVEAVEDEPADEGDDKPAE